MKMDTATKTQDAASQAAMTPEQALEILLEGNQRFLDDRRLERDLGQQVRDTSGGQWPFAAVLGCIDSRVPAETVFDQGIGDLFNVRIAGNFVNEDILGSLEFACKVAGAKLVVVLGHTRCGAIQGACDSVELGHLTTMLQKLRPAVDSVAEPSDASQRTSKNADFVQAVATANVERTVAEVLERSAVLGEMAQAGDIRVVGALYDVETGKVRLAD